LERARLDERGLDGMQLLPPREPLDRPHLPARRLEGRQRARAHRPAVEEDGAGAAHLDVAGLLHAEQAQAVAEALDERLPRRQPQRVDLAVDGQGDRKLAHPGAPGAPAAATACSKTRRRSTPTRCVLYSAEPCRSLTASAARPATRPAAGSAARLSGRDRPRRSASASGIRRGTGPTEPTAMRTSATPPPSSVTATATPAEGRSRM